MGDTGQLLFSGFTGWIWKFSLPLAAFMFIFVVRELMLLERHERRHAVLMFLYFFLIISTYWLIKPVKKAMLVGSYQESGLTLIGFHLDAAQVELLAKLINLFVALLATLLFTRLTSHFKRDKLALIITASFAVGFIALSIWLQRPDHLSAWVFYLYGDLFVTLMVAVFFAFLNDSEEIGSACRMYGLVGLGGVAGGVIGSAAIAGYAKQMAPDSVSLVSVGPLIAISLIAWQFGRMVGRDAPTRPVQTGREAWLQRLRTGMRSIAGSGYILGIAVIVALYEMVSTIMDYQFTATVLHYLSGAELKSHFANVYSFTNIVSLVLQIFVTRALMVHVGVGKALLFLPVAVMLGETAYVLLPGLLQGSLLNTIDNASSYSINQSAKEVLYIPLESDEKYNAKAFIDVFVLRGAKAVAVLFGLLLTMAFGGFENVRWLSIMVFILVLIWLFVVRNLDKSFEGMRKRQVRQ